MVRREKGETNIFVWTVFGETVSSALLCHTVNKL